MTGIPLEQRIEDLEKEVAALKVQISEQPGKTRIYIKKKELEIWEADKAVYELSLLNPSNDS